MGKVLLDTNIWRYLVDAGAVPTLRNAAKRSKDKVAVAPAVVYEALRTKDPGLRRRLVEAMADPAWCRLMPEAFSESQEVRDEIVRLRPGWLRDKPDLTLRKRLLFDWQRSRGGFWDRVINQMEAEARAVSDEDLLQAARAEALQIRDEAKGYEDWVAGTRLDRIKVQILNPSADAAEALVERWRTHSLGFWMSFPQNPNHPYEQWIGGEVITSFLRLPCADLTRFWLYDVETQRLPRQWLRTAMDFLQRFHRVTDGTPGDAQISTYLPDVDLFLSADKNLVRMLQRCASEAPFALPPSKLVSSQQTLEEVLAALRQ